MSSTDVHGVLDRQRTGKHNIRLVERDGSLIHELTSARLESIEWMLNDPGSARISIPTIESRLEPLELGLTEVQVWRNDKLWWWGVPLRMSGDHRKLTLELEGLLGYFSFRFITYTSLEYTSIEQMTIAWNLISHSQSDPNTSFGISAANYTPSGRIRSRRYPRDEHANILDMLQEFTEVDDGFDFDIVTPSSGQRLWTPYYPRKGSRKPNLVLEWGRNITQYTYTEDGVRLANHVYVTGGASGDVKFEENYRDEASVAYRGAFYAVTSEGAQMDVDWLHDKARQEVRERKNPVVIPEITVINQPVELVEELETGDVVPIVIDHGRVQVNEEYRIERITWYPGDKLKLDIVPEAA